MVALILLEMESQNYTLMCQGQREDTPRKRLSSRADGVQSLHQNIGDCIGDIMMQAMLDERIAKSKTSDKEIVINGFADFRPKYYSVESLMLYYMELKKKGWKICMETNNVFHLECPSFEDYPQMALMPSGSQAVTVKSRSYAHPIDLGIIKVLDAPGVKSVVGSAVDMLADVQFSPIVSSGLPVTAKSFPEINAIVDHCTAVLGIKRPYVVVSGSISMNAFTFGSDEEPVIVLGNMLVRVMDKQKLTFIIGHECGHIAMGHVVYHTLVNVASSFANAIPLVGPAVYQASSVALNAWSRRSEITADRAGLLCCQDIEQAKKALLQIESGFIDAESLDMDGYIKNCKRYRRKSVLRRVTEFAASHPPLPKRMEALDLFAHSKLYYETQYLPAPENAISESNLTKSVEKIIAVLGEE